MMTLWVCDMFADWVSRSKWNRKSLSHGVTKGFYCGKKWYLFLKTPVFRMEFGLTGAGSIFNVNNLHKLSWPNKEHLKVK